ncbi:MFS transporter [Conservatibacter flavescens]|uniref:MFS transporter n=2 Tax=Conservatibacter flavescens TaxID=28161 RepID=A0A2M8S5D0_9PAST|nr:MFS transporter [Conservatibacter flavescens]
MKHPNLILFFIALGLFGVFTVEFSVIGLLPMVVERYGVSVAQAGMLVSVFALFAAIGGPLMVLWLAKYSRKRVLIGSLMIFALCCVLSAWAPDYQTLMVLRALPGLMLTVFFSLAFAAAVALYPPQKAAFATSMALMGESVGLVFGLPLILFFAHTFSYETAFLFCAAVCVIAAAGLLRLPDSKQNEQGKTADALVILKKPLLWLGLLATVAVLSSMFGVYSYATEYLLGLGMNANTVSLLMMVFGIGGLAGNVIAGRALAKNIKLTAVAYPFVLALAYAALYAFASPNIAVMALLCAVWGAAHISGLVVSQFWVSSSAEEAPEFATSLFVSAANVGVTVGAASGGWFISNFGIQSSLWAGWGFALLAVVFFAVSLVLKKRELVSG